MKIFSVIMIGFLIISAVSVSVVKNLLGAIIVFTVYSLIMAILWQQLNAPDVAITEAAVGAGITTLLFILTLKRIKGAKR
ncbi:hydrogenase subunit MbhD domain-containing protein [Clostridium sp.]|jgi:energy-converting hydrogenase B subunit D|uniref:hydrogenase subunit MbhD domain-containing protein n=1 Tax=Clostridium sp. TaxID=1506 RepID=UPI0039F5569A